MMLILYRESVQKAGLIISCYYYVNLKVKKDLSDTTNTYK